VQSQHIQCQILTALTLCKFTFLGKAGSGKSTFLAAIAGRTDASLSVSGHVFHYSLELSTTSPEETAFVCAPVLPDSVAWLQQQDAFFERLTVQETLDLAVYLEWPLLTKDQRDEMAQTCLESLGLIKVRTRQVGSPKNVRNSNGASLSGGEMRRLSVALELVVRMLRATIARRSMRGANEVVLLYRRNHTCS
jgi:ABC-type multidrug transport system ATPase subunit